MLEINWFIDELKKLTGKTVLVNEIGYGAIESFQDEVGCRLIPKEHVLYLPHLLLVETMVYDDEEGKEWIAVIVLYGNDERGRDSHLLNKEIRLKVKNHYSQRL